MAEFEGVYSGLLGALLSCSLVATVIATATRQRAQQSGFLATRIAEIASYVLMEGCAYCGMALLLVCAASSVFWLARYGAGSAEPIGTFSSTTDSFRTSLTLSAALLAAGSLHSMKRHASVDTILIDWEKAKARFLSVH
jgi:hypothetical protein